MVQNTFSRLEKNLGRLIAVYKVIYPKSPKRIQLAATSTELQLMK